MGHSHAFRRFRALQHPLCILLLLMVQHACPARPQEAFFDFNGDGFADSVVHDLRDDPGEPVYSRLLVISGADGSTLASFRSDEPNDYFGWLAASLGDLDGDGLPDIAIGAPRGWVSPAAFGRVYVYLSSNTGTPAMIIEDPDGAYTVIGLDAVADQDGDGLPDLLLHGAAPTGQEEIDHNGTLVRRFRAVWRVASSATGEIIASGVGGADAAARGGIQPVPPGAGALTGRVTWSRGLSGDLDADGTVSFADLTRLLEAWASAAGSSRDDGGPVYGDLNRDGAITVSDVAVLLSQYGQRAQPLPEGYTPLVYQGARGPDRNSDPCMVCGTWDNLWACVGCQGSCKDECWDCHSAIACGDPSGGGKSSRQRRR